MALQPFLSMLIGAAVAIIIALLIVVSDLLVTLLRRYDVSTSRH